MENGNISYSYLLKKHRGEKEVNPYVPSKLVDYNRHFGLENQRLNRLIRLELGQRVAISSLLGKQTPNFVSVQRKAL